MSRVPKHVAIIPDGNRRWSRAHGVPSARGYDRGAERFRDIIRSAFQTSGLTHLTIWAASESNLTARGPHEVRTLRTLVHRELQVLRESPDLARYGIRVRIIGRAAELLKDSTITERVHELMAHTAANKKRNLTVLLGYDGRTEMIEAIRSMGRDAAHATASSLHAALWTRDLPPVDLVIRTGGEPHWSAGFLMWLTAESQFIFPETLWPDFDGAAFKAALAEYAARGRRFGA
ncbi:MAG: polyprenyl diphosphate synthase [bacterium]|nr:polyprenyl diphosphate synthase [bacterium]